MTPGVTIVTGTDTDVGKTIVTAALAVETAGTLHVHKPAQTGVGPGDDGDIQTVARLAGLAATQVSEGVRLPDPLAPTTAGRRARIALPTVDAHARRVADLAGAHDNVIVEGAGGILVGLDDAGGTLLDLADAGVRCGLRPRFLVVARAGLGTLNHTALTCDAIRARGHEVLGLVVGALADDPDLAIRCNLAELHLAAGAPLLACLPAGLGSLSPREFRHRILSLPPIEAP